MISISLKYKLNNLKFKKKLLTKKKVKLSMILLDLFTLTREETSKLKKKNRLKSRLLFK